MKKSIAIVFVLMAISCSLIAQDFPKEFLINPSGLKISGSLYNKISVIDCRRDTSNLGIVQVGLANSREKVKAIIPLEIQFQNLLSSLTDSTSMNGELLLQIRQMLFAEETKSYSEKGYFYLRANLFARKSDLYVRLASVDTFIVLSDFDVTNPLLKAGSKLITGFISENLTHVPDNGFLFSYNELVKTDSIEKRKIMIYNTDVYNDGLYYDFNSFKEQVPDREVQVKFNQYSMATVKILDDNKNWVRINHNDFYAFVYEGKPYISTGYGYYPMFKSNDDLYFVGKVKPITPTEDQVMAATVAFGLIGGIIAAAAGPSGETYFTIIDHTSGAFIPFKRMPVKPN